MRQVVEIEYLVWAFNDGSVTPTGWLTSSHKQRLKTFAPRAIRQTSRGRFLDHDYQGHCELGGHPVPMGARFFMKGRNDICQQFLADTITHCWRIWDEFRKWASANTVAQKIIEDSVPVLPVTIKEWSEKDELYKAMVAHFPQTTQA